MPKCVVRKCPHQTGKKSIYPQIVLHPFPKNILLIQDWLRLAGMQEENLQLVSLQILEDKRSDKFRMCSAHFTQDSYVLKGSKRVLKVDARPSKFPEISVLDFAHPPMMHRIAQRARIEQGLTKAEPGLAKVQPAMAISAEGRPVKAQCNCKCHIRLKSRFVNSSTQTEESDFVILASVDPYLSPANHQLHSVDPGYCQTLERGQSTGEKANEVSPSLHIVPVMKWERTGFQLRQENNLNENGFLSSKDVRPQVDYVDEEMVTSDDSSFEIITVEDWEAPELQIKREDLQEENGVPRLEDEDSERGRYPQMTSFSQKTGDAILETKKVFSNEEPNLFSAKSTPTRVDEKEGGRGKVRKPDQCVQSVSPPVQNSEDDVPFDSKKPKRRKNGDPDWSEPSQPLSDKEDTSSPTPPVSLEEKYAKEKKYVVFESCLDILLLNMRCQQKYCSERIKQYDKHTVGTLLVVFATCCGGHNFKLWESQPRVNGVGAGNVLLATMLVLTGSSFSKIKGLCDIIALQIFSESSFHRYEDKYIFPSIDQWIQEEDESEMVCKIEEEDVVLDRRRSV